MPKLRAFNNRVIALFILGLCSGCTSRAPEPEDGATPQLMTPRDLQALTSNPPDTRVAYGQDSSQYGELRLPPGPGPHPVVVLIHGGCFKAAYAKAGELGPIADALKADGIATWNLEYRRLGEPGGGWPGTYHDVGRGIDHLKSLAGENNLDLSRVVLLGHSAGGHLAMWAAGRGRLDSTSELHQPDPLPVRGVIDLAGPIDLRENIAHYEATCGDSVITSLLGGTPVAVPERYAQVSASDLLPLHVAQVLIWGEHEEFVPMPLAQHHVERASAAGDLARLITVPTVGHFELAAPHTASWQQVHGAVRALLDGRLPD